MMAVMKITHLPLLLKTGPPYPKSQHSLLYIFASYSITLSNARIINNTDFLTSKILIEKIMVQKSNYIRLQECLGFKNNKL